MEKLIELLNEFEKEVYADEHEHIEYPDGTWDDGEYWFEGDSSILGEEDGLNWSGSDYRCYNSDLVIISKKFGFIKWLVDNDKIDFKKFDGDNYNYLENPIGSNNYDECDYLELIQWLAISDTPIKDLIYYLK